MFAAIRRRPARPHPPRPLSLAARPSVHPLLASLQAAALALFGATIPATGFSQSVQQPREKPQGVAPEPETATTGELQVVDPDGKLVGRFPLRHTEVRASVSGAIAEVTVEQFFENPYDRSIEAVYVFPLPEDAAVNDLEIRIGERVVRGEIHERQKAREIYEQAKQQGRTAALLDQERPNVFTQSVANIQPGHEIVVKLRYADLLRYEDGAYEMVFPTVVGPRYIPGQATRPGGGTGWSRDTDRVPDASRITPPVVPPGARAGHDIMIAVDLHAGVPLQDVQSVNHAVDVERPDASAASIRLRPSDTIPNKDFVLRWRVAGPGPEFGLLPHRGASRDGFGYFTFLLQPEAEVTPIEARPKEMVFVLDCSGSMSGEPIAKAKAAVRWALQHLNPDDTFQVIRFSERSSPFAPGPVPNTFQNVQRALAYVEGLQGEGGTEMLSGIEAALGFAADRERTRIVCFLTDGYIGNEEEILSAVRDRIGAARLFSFGVGSSVNRYLLDGLAHEGRGVADFIPLDAETRPLVEKFYARIAKPYLTDLSLDWGGLDVTDVYPEKLPDLFAGQPLVLAGRYRHAGHGEVVIRGHLGRRTFERRIRVDLPEKEAGNGAVDVLWARRRIDETMRQMLQGERKDLVQQVTDTALEFRLVTRYTSFVATDNQVVSKGGTPMLVAQPVEMPEGVSLPGMGIPTPTFAYGYAAPAVPPSASMSRGGAGGVLSMLMSPFALRASAPRSAAAPRVEGVVRAPMGKSSAQVDAKSRPDETSPRIDPVFGPESLEVRIEPEHVSFRSGAAVSVTLVLRNTGPQAIDVPAELAVRDGTLQLRILRDGTLVPAPRIWRATSLATTRLAPGATRRYTVRLDDLGGYAFAVPGHYTIVVEGIAQLTLPASVAQCTLRVR